MNRRLSSLKLLIPIALIAVALTVRTQTTPAAAKTPATPQPVPASKPKAASAPVLGSTAVSWDEIEAKNGQFKQVFRNPTATLDELEMHVTTLAPGQSP